MTRLLVLALFFLAESCHGHYYGNYLPGPPGYVAPVEGECGCCPPPCCCTCVETGVPATTTTTTTVPPTTPEIICEHHLDLGFVMDSSGSIGANDWIVAKQFVADITDTFGDDIGDDGTLVGMVMYSNNATVVWDFTSDYTQSKEDLQSAILGMKLIGGFTNTVEGLEKANTELFNAVGDRNWPDDSDAVPNVVVVITDGRANFRPNELPAMTDAMKETATVVVIGVTTEINMTELLMIASRPELVFTVDDFTSLTDILRDIKVAVCPTRLVITKPPPPPPAPVVIPKKECFCCCPPPPGYPEIGHDCGGCHDHVHWHPPYGCPC